MPMTATDIAVKQLEVDEGFRSHIYLDTRGNRTIGYGCNLDSGVSEYAAQALLQAQVIERVMAIQNYWWAAGLDDARMSVLIELAFNDGVEGLLHFVKCLGAIGHQQWQMAHDELLDSDAARELPQRYERLAKILLTGIP